MADALQARREIGQALGTPSNCVKLLGSPLAMTDAPQARREIGHALGAGARRKENTGGGTAPSSEGLVRGGLTARQCAPRTI
jgi:hypothetical protein